MWSEQQPNCKEKVKEGDREKWRTASPDRTQGPWFKTPDSDKTVIKTCDRHRDAWVAPNQLTVWLSSGPDLGILGSGPASGGDSARPYPAPTLVFSLSLSQTMISNSLNKIKQNTLWAQSKASEHWLDIWWINETFLFFKKMYVKDTGFFVFCFFSLFNTELGSKIISKERDQDINRSRFGCGDDYGSQSNGHTEIHDTILPTFVICSKIFPK